MNSSTIIFSFEENFDRDGGIAWIRAYWKLSFVYVIIYLLLIYLGEHWMHARRAFDLRGALAVWNWSLAAFSLMGIVRCFPQVYDEWNRYGFEHTICNVGSARDNPILAFWSWCFIMSKVVELGDTAFIILRKRPLVFLHWYHHVTVLLYSWYSAQQMIPTARWFSLMNGFVHTLMYTYFALRAANLKIPRTVAMTITIAQLMQMLGGLYANWRAYQVNIRGQKCETGLWNIKISLLMYGSYWLLFANLFYNSYVKKQQREKIA